MRRDSGDYRRPAMLAASLLLLPAMLPAVPTTYLHETDATCGGNSPCFDRIEDALIAVDNGGTVIILSDITGNILATEGRQNVTLMGMPETVEISNNIVIEEVVTGWTIKDLEVTSNFRIQNVAGSLTVENVVAPNFKIGDLTQDTNAAIILRDSDFTGGPVSIIGLPGASLNGSVLIDNISANSARIRLEVASGPATNLGADVSILNSQLANAGGLSVQGVTTTGSGGVTGAVEYSNNISTLPGSKFGVITFGNVTGNISGPVTMRDNQLDWIAVLNTEATAGNIGQLTMTGNIVEALEFQAVDGALTGPIEIRDNQVLDLGGATGLAYPLILVDGEGVLAEVTVEDNHAPGAYVVVRGEAPGVIDAPVSMSGNAAGQLTLESVGGDFGDTYTVAANFLATSADPLLSRLTVRALGGGDSLGGVIAGNSSDEFVINFEGFLTGDLETTGNLVRQQATLQATGNLGGAEHNVTGNDFEGNVLVNGLDSLVRFNRLIGDISVIQGTTVDASRNWWGCDEGPGQPGCSEPQTAGLPVTPWLTFSGEATCNGPMAVAVFDLLTASNGSTPAGNITPGTTLVTSADGTVENPFVPMSAGAGCTTMFVNGGVDDPMISMQFDSETVVDTADCTAGLPLPPCAFFADGFESGDTSAWSNVVP